MVEAVSVGGEVNAANTHPDPAAPDQLAVLLVTSVPVAGLETPRRSLEDEFVELTGEGFDVD